MRLQGTSAITYTISETSCYYAYRVRWEHRATSHRVIPPVATSAVSLNNQLSKRQTHWTLTHRCLDIYSKCVSVRFAHWKFCITNLFWLFKNVINITVVGLVFWNVYCVTCHHIVTSTPAIVWMELCSAGFSFTFRFEIALRTLRLACSTKVC